MDCTDLIVSKLKHKPIHVFDELSGDGFRLVVFKARRGFSGHIECPVEFGHHIYFEIVDTNPETYTEGDLIRNDQRYDIINCVLTKDNIDDIAAKIDNSLSKMNRGML